MSFSQVTFPSYKQKFDCLLIAFLNVCPQTCAVLFYFNSAVKTEGNDGDEVIEILSSPERSPEKKM